MPKVIRFIDTSKTQGVEHAALLLRDSWRLTWTKTLISDADHSIYVQALEDLVRIIQKEHNVALLRPDPPFNCLRRFHFHATPTNEQEIRHARQFLLAVTRRVFEKLGQQNPYVLCFDNWSERRAQAARNATTPVDPFVPQLPPLVRRFALDRKWGTQFLLNGPIEMIGKSFNEWRMENGLDPVYQAYVEPVVAKWRELILDLLQNNNDRPTPRPSVVSVEGDDSDLLGLHQMERRVTGDEGKLDLVVPSLCLQFARDRKLNLKIVQQPGVVETLVDDITRWRKEKSMTELPRPYIATTVATWKQNVDLVLQSVETSEDKFLESLDEIIQSFLRDRHILTADQFVALDNETIKQQYREWRQQKGLKADIHTDMDITDGRSRIVRLQAAVCAFRLPSNDRRPSDKYAMKSNGNSEP